MANADRVAVVGNPNVGKTSLFNILTGSTQRVGNWAGVTVEKKTGKLKLNTQEYEIVDLPGIYSFSAHSMDEIVARNFILDKNEGPQAIVNIVDASNLERNLYLTMQLKEMQVPVIIALNMNDVAESKDIQINAEKLESLIGMPVVKINARENKGIDDLKNQIYKLSESQSKVDKIQYSKDIEKGISDILDQIEGELKEKFNNPYWAALKILENDEEVVKKIENTSLIQPIIDKLSGKFDDDLDIVLAELRYEKIEEIVRACRKQLKDGVQTRSDKIDKVVLHRVWGIPVFLVIMWLMFKFAVDIGGSFIDFFDISFGATFVDGLGKLLGDGWLKIFLADGIGGGIQTVATFIPPIFMLFLAIGLLEDSGYMARAAFVVDRAMRALGLPGKAFVPMLMGFGCNAPAIMATRTLEDEDDRKMAIMMNPFMSCGARLPVYTLLAAAFFPSMKGTITFSMYIVGIIVAIITGFIFKAFVFKKKHLSPFVMELPNYHAPRLAPTLRLAWQKTYTFIKRAGLMVLAIVVILQILGNISVGKKGEDFEAFSKNSLAGAIGTAMTIPLKPMGIQEKNWPAAVGIFTGLFAKEAVIGTLESSYKAMEAANKSKKEEKKEEEEAFKYWSKIGEAFSSIKTNLIGSSNDKGEFEPGLLAKASFYIPFYEFVQGLSESEEFSEGKLLRESFTDEKISNAEARNGLAAAAAYAFMLFILLYVPCVAVLGVVYKELGSKWMMIQIGYQLIIAYGVATVFYQVAKAFIL